MPRLIDHEARATEITEAAWRVLLRDGVAGVSVRNVAAEAGVATASLRRSFPTQAALLAACLTLMGERVAARIRALPRARDPLAQALAALAETMPLDGERSTEMSVYLALGNGRPQRPRPPSRRMPRSTVNSKTSALAWSTSSFQSPDAEISRGRLGTFTHSSTGWHSTSCTAWPGRRHSRCCAPT
ncbi:MAG: TetR family transcriptional regulator [Dermatophilaceae bacterium]